MLRDQSSRRSEGPTDPEDLNHAESLGIKGNEKFDILGIDQNIKPQQDVTVVIRRSDGSRQEVSVRLRIDTAIEVDYYRNGGILPFVLRDILRSGEAASCAA